jgi:hypothetical protein
LKKIAYNKPGSVRKKTNQRQIRLQKAICGVRENGQIANTVWKINLKQKERKKERKKERAEIGKVKPSILKHIQIKLVYNGGALAMRSPTSTAYLSTYLVPSGAAFAMWGSVAYF